MGDRRAVSTMGIARYFLPFLGFLFFCLFNVQAVSWLFPGYSTYDLQRMVALSFFALMTAALLLSLALRRAFLLAYARLQRKTRLLLGIFFVSGILSACLAALPRYALLDVFTVLELFLVALLIAALKTHYRVKFDRVAMLVLLATIAYYVLNALMLLIHYLQGNAAVVGGDINAFLGAPGFTNERFLMQAILLSLPFLALPFALFTKKWLWPFFYAVGAYWWCLALVNQSRAFVLTTIISFVAVLIFYGKDALRYMLIQILLALGGVLLFLCLYQFPAHVAMNHVLSTMTTDRLLLWRLAVQMIGAHPWLGVGPLHYPFYAYGSEQYAAHPHNFVLQVAAEWGMVAAVCLPLLILLGLICLVKSATVHLAHEKSLLPLALTASLISAMADASVSGLTVTPLAQLLLAIVIGMAMGMTDTVCEPVAKQLKTPDFFDHTALVLLLLLGAFFIGNGLKGVVNRLPQMNFNYLMTCQSQGCLLSPNYFVQGFIQFYDAPPSAPLLVPNRQTPLRDAQNS